MDTDKLILPRAPINEIGFSVVTKSSLVDPFSMKDLHSRLENKYPRIERQAPVAMLEPGNFVGIPNAISDEDMGVAPRWWMISEDDERLVQAQERFVAWNWRRRADFGSNSRYPGFDSCFADARSYFDVLLDHHKEAGLTPPEVGGCDLFYDNVIPLQVPEGDTMIRFDTVLRNWNSVTKRPTSGIQINWYEPIGDGEPQAHEVTSVRIAVAGLIRPEAPEPIAAVSIQFHAASSKVTWSELDGFFSRAHDHISNRFREVLTDAAYSEFCQ